jgi:hypothetical protein
MKKEDPAYGSASEEKPGHYLSEAQVNKVFYVQEFRFLLGSGV